MTTLFASFAEKQTQEQVHTVQLKGKGFYSDSVHMPFQVKISLVKYYNRAKKV